jgi:hypothetical protein
LAFQLLIGKVANANLTKSIKPKAAVGVCRIYDLRQLRDDFKDGLLYQQFISEAFRPDEDLWGKVSPAKVTGPNGIADAWENGQLAVLVSSTSDVHIDTPQLKTERKALEPWKSKVSWRKVVAI